MKERLNRMKNQKKEGEEEREKKYQNDQFHINIYSSKLYI